MKRSTNELIAHGIIGGLLAGLVVAVWFAVVDTVRWGHPFVTPTDLASALYHEPGTGSTFWLVAMYSVVHFGVFACLGIAATWVMVALHQAPRLLLGVFFGIVVQELLFYTGLYLSGWPPSEVIPWDHVIGANLLAGLVLMSYLRRAERAEAPLGPAVLNAHPQVRRGLITGFIGAAVVAVWFLLLDLVAGHPFATPAALGSAVLIGASNVRDVAANFGVVAAYTVVHLVAFAVAGLVFVMIAEQVERSPSFLLLAVMTVILLEGVVVAAMALGAQWVLGAPGVWSALVANVLAVSSMSWYVWRMHPTLRRKLSGIPLGVRV
jgi:hypothetical protein